MTDTQSNSASTVLSQSSNQVLDFLTFSLGDEHYGLDILQVREIRGYEKVTKIPNAPAFIKGVLNLRGDVVPIVDLRVKFSIGEATYNEFTIVIMLQINHHSVGIVVDAVSDVIQLSPQDIKPPPELATAFDKQFLKGLVQCETHLLILLNIEKLISSEELGLYDKDIASQEKE